MEVDELHRFEMDDGITEIREKKSQNMVSMTPMVDSELLKEAFEKLLDEMLENIIIDFCFEKHEAFKASVNHHFFFPEEYKTKNGKFESCSEKTTESGSETPNKSTRKKDLECICPCCGSSFEYSSFTTHLERKFGLLDRASRNVKNKGTSSDFKSVSLQPKSVNNDGYSLKGFKNLPEEEKEIAIQNKCLAITKKKGNDQSFLLCKNSVKCSKHNQQERNLSFLF